jgi:antitoxin (DNA-binding transcriptional repressor) of toxin-antitoxin stability system
MLATATQVKNNFGKYLAIAQKQDVLITKNGKTVAILKTDIDEKLAKVDRLFGILRESEKSTQDPFAQKSLAEWRDERLKERYDA